MLLFQGKNLFLLDVKNDEAFPPSDRFLLIPSLSGGGWVVIFPSCSVKLPLSSCTRSVAPFLQAHTNFLFTNAFFFFFFVFLPELRDRQRAAAWAPAEENVITKRKTGWRRCGRLTERLQHQERE